MLHIFTLRVDKEFVNLRRLLTTSTFADDTAILSRSKCPMQATAQLALHLIDVENSHFWRISDWRIKVNEQKCKHVTFILNVRCTRREGVCCINSMEELSSINLSPDPLSTSLTNASAGPEADSFRS